MVQRAGLIRAGGRTERTRDAVLSVARDLLEHGETDLSVTRLSALSGVHKTTIYRRWPTREILLHDLMKERRRSLDIPTSKSWQAYLSDLAIEMADFLSSPGELALMKTLLAADPAYAAEVDLIWLPLADSLAAPLVAAQARGEIAAEVEATTIIRLLIGFIVSETLFTRKRPPQPMLDQVARMIADGIKRRAAPVRD
jgi:AcrR family transcriptional regulator